MALANQETPFDIGVDAALSETSLRKVPILPQNRADRDTSNLHLFSKS